MIYKFLTWLTKTNKLPSLINSQEHKSGCRGIEDLNITNKTSFPNAQNIITFVPRFGRSQCDKINKVPCFIIVGYYRVLLDLHCVSQGLGFVIQGLWSSKLVICLVIYSIEKGKFFAHLTHPGSFQLQKAIFKLFKYNTVKYIKVFIL